MFPLTLLLPVRCIVFLLGLLANARTLPNQNMPALALMCSLTQLAIHTYVPFWPFPSINGAGSWFPIGTLLLLGTTYCSHASCEMRFFEQRVAARCGRSCCCDCDTARCSGCLFPVGAVGSSLSSRWFRIRPTHVAPALQGTETR